MKITLNLLPKNREKKIRNRKILNFIILQEIMIIFITLLFFGIIQGLDAVAKLRLMGVDQELSQNNERTDFIKIKEYEDNLRTIKSQVDFVKRVQNSNVNFVPMLSKLAEILPREISVTSITGEGYVVDLVGTAKNRDTLIEMKQNMEKDGCFKDIVIPLNNIVLREDIDFELSFSIEEKCIINYEKK